MGSKTVRLEAANELIRVIASCGRRFFSNREHPGANFPNVYGATADQVAFLRISAQGHLYFVDNYTNKPIYTHYAGRWRHFSHGGTLRELVIALREFVLADRLLQSHAFGPWPEWICDGDLWGYGDDMQIVRDAANRLGVIKPIPKQEPAA